MPPLQLLSHYSALCFKELDGVFHLVLGGHSQWRLSQSVLCIHCKATLDKERRKIFAAIGCGIVQASATHIITLSRVSLGFKELLHDGNTVSTYGISKARDTVAISVIDSLPSSCFNIFSHSS